MRRVVLGIILVLIPVAIWAAPVWPPPAPLSNGFVYLVPVLAWNIALTSSLDIDRFFSGNAPEGLLVSETIARVFVFGYPLFLATDAPEEHYRRGIALYSAGSALYYGSWIAIMALPESVVSEHPLLSLAPAYTPLVVFAGIAAMTRSPIYLAGAAVFVALHTMEYVLRLP